MHRDPALPERRFSAAHNLRSISKVMAHKSVQKRKRRPKSLRGMPEPRPLTAEQRTYLAQRGAQIRAEIAREETVRAWLREISPTVREIKTRLEALDEETASSVLLCDRDWLCEHLGDLLESCQWASKDWAQEAASSDARNKSIKNSVLARAVTELVADLPVRLTREAKLEFASRLAPLERMYLIRKELKNSSTRTRGRRPDRALRQLVILLMGVYEDFTDQKPGTSVSGLDGKAGGPLIRFLGTCLRLLGIDKSPAALRSLIRSTDRYKETHS